MAAVSATAAASKADQKDVLDKTVQFLQKREGIDKVCFEAWTLQCPPIVAQPGIAQHWQLLDLTGPVATTADPQDHKVYIQAYSRSQSTWK